MHAAADKDEKGGKFTLWFGLFYFRTLVVHFILSWSALRYFYAGAIGEGEGVVGNVTSS